MIHYLSNCETKDRMKLLGFVNYKMKLGIEFKKQSQKVLSKTNAMIYFIYTTTIILIEKETIVSKYEQYYQAN